MPERSGQKKGAGARRAPAAEHRRLRMLLSEKCSSLARRAEGRAARRALDELSESLEARFRQEESLYYPTLLALRPRFRSPLQNLIESHRSFRSRVDALAAALEADAFSEARSQLEGLAKSLDRHQRAEDELLLRLEREVRDEG